MLIILFLLLSFEFSMDPGTKHLLEVMDEKYEVKIVVPLWIVVPSYDYFWDYLLTNFDFK